MLSSVLGSVKRWALSFVPCSVGYEFDLKHCTASRGGLWQHESMLESTPKLLYSKGRMCTNT